MQRNAIKHCHLDTPWPCNHEHTAAVITYTRLSPQQSMSRVEVHEAPPLPEELYHISYVLSYKVKYSLSMHSGIISLQ